MLLRRANVVNGAIELLDRDGLDGLTTRKLGAALNVQGPALYRHFPSKQALLDAVADRLIDGVAAPLPPGPWADQLTVLASRLRTAMLSHRDGARVVAGTYVAGPNTRLVETAIFGILEAAALPADRAGWSAFALSHYVLGHTIEEQAQAQLEAAGSWEDRAAMMTQSPETAYGRTALTAAFEADPADRFAYGFGLFLDGLRARLIQPAPAKRRPRPSG